MAEQAQAQEKIWQVSEVNRIVRELLEQSFYPFWIQGELSNLTVHRSGHVYMTIKDSKAQLSAVFFRGAANVRQLELEEGSQVEIRGRLSLYEPRGIYQLIVNRIRPKGKGELQKLFEERKQKLRNEGLFDEERKRSLPALPRTIGVITSPQGAAIRDFLQILERRFANVRIRIFPAAVQGEGAASQIADGINFFNHTGDCDVLVVTRGGGSLEDLWPFNEESVARSVAASEIPVISAVGHEVDFTICDFAADLRVPTPSAAAELVIGKKAELEEKIMNLRNRLEKDIQLRLSNLKWRFEKVANSYVFREPGNLVRTYQQRIDELAERMTTRMKNDLELKRQRVQSLDNHLQAISPKKVLERGYSILLHERDGADSEEAVTCAGQTATGNKLRGILHKGELELTVDKVLAPLENRQADG